MKLKLITLSAALLAFGGAAQALGVTNKSYVPNTYNCTGDNVKLSYLVKPSHVVQSSLSLTLDGKNYSATNSTTLAEIDSLATPLGYLVTISTEILPDAFVNKASVIIPDITLGTNAMGVTTSSFTFPSQLILTTVNTPFIVPPYIGPVEVNSFLNLECKATFVPYP